MSSEVVENCKPSKWLMSFLRSRGNLSKVQLKVGDKVAKGQILATVRSGELLQRVEKITAALEAATADLRQKESRLADAEKALKRAHELHSRDLISARDLKETEAARDTARAQQALTHAQVAEQQAALQQTRYLLAVSKLVAPLSGVVTRISPELAPMCKLRHQYFQWVHWNP